MLKQVCKNCKKMLPLDSFYKAKKNKTGYEGICKTCRKSKRPKYEKTCKYCNKIYTTINKNSKYCSQKCSGKDKRRRVKTQCTYCGNTIELVSSHYKSIDNHFCNKDCWRSYLSENMEGSKNHNYNRIEYNCDGCDKPIMVIPSTLKNQEHIFCSNECYKENIGKFYTGKNSSSYFRKVVCCDNCNKKFNRKPSEIGNGNIFCSKECYFEFRKKNAKGSTKVRTTCDNCNKEYYVLPSNLKNRRYNYCSIECKNDGFSKYFSGSNSPIWNHNKSLWDRLIERKYPKYTEWREDTYRKNNYKCCKCGNQKGGNLNAHHIYNYSEYPNLRTDLNNGITLCESCHKEFHKKFGYTGNNKKQIQYFLKQTLI